MTIFNGWSNTRPPKRDASLPVRGPVPKASICACILPHTLHKYSGSQTLSSATNDSLCSLSLVFVISTPFFSGFACGTAYCFFCSPLCLLLLSQLSVINTPLLFAEDLVCDLIPPTPAVRSLIIHLLCLEFFRFFCRRSIRFCDFWSALNEVLDST